MNCEKGQFIERSTHQIPENICNVRKTTEPLTAADILEKTRFTSQQFSYVSPKENTKSTPNGD